MRANPEDIVDQLKRLKNLEECVLLEVVWHNYALDVDLVFDYIWDEKGNIRKDLDTPKRLVLSFYLVQEFHFQANLNDSMCLEPERINWGINEVALVKLNDTPDFLHRYTGLSIPIHHIEVVWEDERRISIIFNRMASHFD